MQIANVRVSARDLGQISLNDFCPRCFWFTKKFPLSENHPFRSPMPGIVSQSDSYIKRTVKTHFQRTGSLPHWLIEPLSSKFDGLSFNSVRLIEPKKWEHKLQLSGGQVILVGEPDAILEFNDGSWFIADYKTASLSERQKELLPLYEAQLNAYAYLAQCLENKRIDGAALVYLESEHKTEDIADDRLLERTQDQFMWGFKCSVVPVKLWAPSEVERICRSVFAILSSTRPPLGKGNCEGCQAFKEWFDGIRGYL